MLLSVHTLSGLISISFFRELKIFSIESFFRYVRRASASVKFLLDFRQKNPLSAGYDIFFKQFHRLIFGEFNKLCLDRIFDIY